MNRVLYIWQSDYPWDVRTEKVCAALTDAGYDVHIAARNRRGEPVRERRPEGVVHRIPTWRWPGTRVEKALQAPAFFSPRWLALLSRIVQRERPSVVIVRDLPLCLAAIWLGRQHGIPVVLDMAENYPGTLHAKFAAGRQTPFDFIVRNPRAFELIERYCIRNVDHVLVVVEESADRLVAAGAARNRIDIVSNTPPIERAQSPGRDPARPVGAPLNIVYLGIHTFERGLLELIDAVRLLRDQNVQVRATIVGVGRDTELLRARTRQLGLSEEDVLFTGFLEKHSDALAIAAGADIGVIPSRKTAQSDSTIPNKLFDYMAAGVAVLTSNAAPCARIVRETGAGDVFRAGDAADLAAAVRRLADPEVRQLAGEAGRRAVIERYNWENDASVLRDVIARVIARSGHAVPAHKQVATAVFSGRSV